MSLPRAHILVVVSDPKEAEELELAIRRAGHEPVVTPNVDAALRQVEAAAPDVALVALEAADDHGLALLRRARARADHTSIVALARSGDTEVLADAIRAGADHCLLRPLEPEALTAILARALEKPALARRAEAAESAAAQALDIGRFGEIVGSHPSMQKLLRKVEQAARSRATILIHGETGTGKELIAAAIHENSRRAGGPYVRLNCAALADSVLESELFGHEKGAFTGAVARRRGRFERAAGGTLFLDEVSEIPKPVQVKLLRFLQEREFERVGGDDTVRVDVRIVAATNRDLKAMVADGQFREDLYYRLNVVRLEVPPLRARPSDIPALAESFLRRYLEDEEKELEGFSEEALQQLLRYPWTGNVRELQNAIEQAVVLAEGNRIEVEDLPIMSMEESESAMMDPIHLMIPGVTLAELERYAITKTLQAVGGSPTRAAKLLGVSRRTIQYRMQEYGLTRAPKNPSLKTHAD